MKTIYLECNMGAAGDMLMSALYEICDQKEWFLHKKIKDLTNDEDVDRYLIPLINK